jgi:hypothetical protein
LWSSLPLFLPPCLLLVLLMMGTFSKATTMKPEWSVNNFHRQDLVSIHLGGGGGGETTFIIFQGVASYYVCATTCV